MLSAAQLLDELMGRDRNLAPDEKRSNVRWDNESGPGPSGKNEEKVKVLTEKIEDLVVQIEELGSEGRVEEAQGMMKLVEQLKEEREMLSSTPSVSQLTPANRPTDASQDTELQTRNGADPVTIGGLGAETGIGNVNAAGATTERGGAVVSALTENVAPAAATGGDRAAQSANHTATEEKSSSKKESDAATIKASSEPEPMQTEAASSSPLLNGQQELLQSEGDTQSN
ncbi:hypothetical protein GOODEAATRI_024377 [Goodea atripinnis]|uniref:Uncharacterized protein n=1 Tax=Goodea atripinnis TaxID=208336 RepID=A0ABV0ND63_9TELE